MPRTEKLLDSVQSAIRMPREFWDRADALIAYVGGRRGGTTTRTDVLREAVARGLSLLEREREKDRP